MVFKTISTKQACGAMLVDVMVGLAISSLVLASVAALCAYGGRSFVGMSNYSDLESTSRRALDIITREVRTCRGVTNQTGNSISFIDADASTFSYEYDPQNRTLTRIKGNDSHILLTGCDSVSWGIFQRTPIAGTGEVYPASDLKTARLIQVSWSCSRMLLGKKRHTETIQSTKIVIRKKQS